MKAEYMPTPTRNATTFVVHTPGMRIIRMYTSGWLERSSVRTQSASRTRPPAIPPSVLGDPQPQVVAWLIATSRTTRPDDIRVAASQLTRPGTLIGDSGTMRQVASVVIRITISGAQKSQWYERLFMI